MMYELEDYREFILAWKTAGRPLDDILDELLQLTGVRPNRRTLSRRIRQWQGERGALNTVLEGARERVEELVASGATRQEIVQSLEEEDIRVSLRTLARALSSWNITLQAPRIVGDFAQQVDERIRESYYEFRHTDATASDIMEEDNLHVSSTTLGRRRRALGLYQRVPKSLQPEYEERTREIVSEALRCGHLEDYGRGMIYNNLRANHGLVGRDRVYDVVRELNPEAVERRRKKESIGTRLSALVLPGPDHAWSIDAHCKFEYWGFQIYAAIDGYSRKIMWAYVGITGRTAVSVLAQYITTIRQRGVIPAIVRSDRGAETTLAADAHFHLRRLVQQRVSEEELQFQDCFWFGTSKQNQRIESWWAQVSKSTANRWRVTFKIMAEERIFNADSLADRCAILAVYMPILRHEIYEFVKDWNRHSIRRQPKRPWSVPGIPSVLYRYPSQSGGQQSGFQVPEEAYNDLAAIEQDLEGFDINEYLPATTREWCEDALQRMGYSQLDGRQYDPEEGNRMHISAYKDLQRALQEHIASGVQPLITESEKPFYSREWQPTSTIQRAFQSAGQHLTSPNFQF